MSRLGFLHTAEVHVGTFDRLAAELAPGTDVVHRVDAALLADARVDGATHGGGDGVRRRVDEHLRALVDDGADVVVCTCSTLAGVAEEVGRRTGRVVLRVDRPMAQQAVRLAHDAGGAVLVVAALDSTLGPTRSLLAEVAGPSPVEVVETVARCAWERFEAGDHEGYLSAVAAAGRDAVTADVAVVVLAQASAAGAVALLDDLGVPVLASPRTAVLAAAALLPAVP